MYAMSIFFSFIFCRMCLGYICGAEKKRELAALSLCIDGNIALVIFTRRWWNCIELIFFKNIQVDFSLRQHPEIFYVIDGRQWSGKLLNIGLIEVWGTFFSCLNFIKNYSWSLKREICFSFNHDLIELNSENETSVIRFPFCSKINFHLQLWKSGVNS